MSYSVANRDKHGNALAPPAAPQVERLVPSRHEATAKQREQLYSRVTDKIMDRINKGGSITVDVHDFNQAVINAAMPDIEAAGWYVEPSRMLNDIVSLELS
ncbi:hypothetical protein [Loigolactobacillus bifermentans]|uniref:Uncharacterized protein n=1 Tax=Loigolactobacillus bifermentans DSM 20003 TaxID=1423726 RepID=A0A0R1HB78_9LACO|nr:hypothetical protein [Loigolactobacillus bifermentans]KRK40906.1 hypothetical protein FC07_GL002659 [Loigolactobacillus bifermentans DSM 20003]QGG59657.1 hypothetical protein LB003_03705 [Loigolactobacillus bifermentans]